MPLLLCCSSGEAAIRARSTWELQEGSGFAPGAVKKLRLYMKMLNLFSGFPHHEQDSQGLEPEEQLPHSFTEVSLLKKNKLFLA